MASRELNFHRVVRGPQNNDKYS